MSPKRTILTWGLIAGAVSISMMLATMPFVDRIGFEHGMVIGYTALVLSALMIYPGVRSYRDNVAGGTITFARACLVGLGIVGVATVCYVATWELIYYQLAPDVGQKYMDYAIEEARKAGASAAELAEKSRELARFQEMYRNPLVNIAVTFLEPLPVALIVSLVTAGVLGRRKKGDPNGAEAAPGARG